jgi:hypothetical protein
MLGWFRCCPVCVRRRRRVVVAGLLLGMGRSRSVLLAVERSENPAAWAGDAPLLPQHSAAVWCDDRRHSLTTRAPRTRKSSGGVQLVAALRSWHP